MMNELMTGRFQGDVIEGVLSEDGTILVSALRICDSLGLNWSGQLQRLKRQAWASMCVLHTEAQGGVVRQVTMMPLKQVPMWLSGVSVNAVKPGIRAKLLAYQLEVVEVLSAYFLGISDKPGLAEGMAELRADLEGQIEMQRDELTALSTQVNELVLDSKAVQARAQRFQANMLSATHPDGPNWINASLWTAREWLECQDFVGISGKLTAGDARSISCWCQEISDTMKIPVGEKVHPRFGTVKAFRTNVMIRWQREWEAAQLTIEQLRAIARGNYLTRKGRK